MLVLAVMRFPVGRPLRNLPPQLVIIGRGLNPLLKPWPHTKQGFVRHLDLVPVYRDDYLGLPGLGVREPQPRWKPAARCPLPRVNRSGTWHGRDGTGKLKKKPREEREALLCR